MSKLKDKIIIEINKRHYLNDTQQTYSSKAILDNIKRTGRPYSLGDCSMSQHQSVLSSLEKVVHLNRFLT